MGISDAAVPLLVTCDTWSRTYGQQCLGTTISAPLFRCSPFWHWDILARVHLDTAIERRWTFGL